MLFDVEFAVRIQKANRHDTSPRDTDGVCEQLANKGRNGDTRLSETEKLVQSAADLFFRIGQLDSSITIFLEPDSELTIVKIIPIIHIRAVLMGMDGSSVGDTTARTSGYGESSAS